ncbi:hypothetical protein, partial [uncultured Marivita sp.]|uniref:hypothetical protein n=1 Tax=uncultured Marivita sp. TaxID=888080 RepID=UPI0026069FFB
PPRLRHAHRLMSRRVASAPPVKGYLESGPQDRKQKFQENRRNLEFSCNPLFKNIFPEYFLEFPAPCPPPIYVL